MAISITVRYSRSEITDGLQSYDLNVKVMSATDMPKEIFVLQRGLAVPNTPPAPSLVGVDSFICLADPVDLEEFPIGAPVVSMEMPYFRVAEITLRFRSFVDLEETENLIKEDIEKLVEALKLAASLLVTEDVTYA